MARRWHHKTSPKGWGPGLNFTHSAPENYKAKSGRPSTSKIANNTDSSGGFTNHFVGCQKCGRKSAFKVCLKCFKA